MRAKVGQGSYRAEDLRLLGVGAISIALLVLTSMGCRPVYRAEFPRSAGDIGLITHCLGSLGLTDRSSEPDHSAAIAKDPGLLAVWASRYSRSHWYPGATAFVRREPDRWQVAFFPGPAGGPASADVFAEGFSRCIAVHHPGTHVDVDFGEGASQQAARSDRGQDGKH